MKSCWMLRQLRVIAIVGACFAFLAPVGAKAAAYNYSSLVMNADSGEILYAVNADMPRYPASLTKMMTLYLLFEALDQGRTHLHDSIYISSHAASQSPSKIGLPAGGQISVENAILAVVTKSANDIAVAIAEHLAGSEEAFAERMTARAHAIGMSNSNFRNASGLPDSDQTTTARDMATLGHALIKRFPHYYPYFSTASFYYGGHSHPNHNRMLGTYEGIDGIKTGYINASGFNLVASAKRDQGRLIGVVFGAQSSAQRARIMGSLLDNGFVALQTGVFPDAPVEQVLTAEKERDRGNHSQTVTSAAADSWAIQVDRQKDRLRALQTGKRAADKIKDITPASLSVVALRVKKGSTTYVPQLAGLTQTQARSACRSLRAGGMSCRMLRQGDTPMSASAATAASKRSGKTAARTVAKATSEKKVAAKSKTAKASAKKTVALKRPQKKPEQIAEIGSVGGFEKAVRKAAKLSAPKPSTVASGASNRSGKKTGPKGTGGEALVEQNRPREPQS